MGKTVVLAMLAVVACAVTSAAASASGTAKSAFVTNANDAGPGSFRAAIDKANADPALERVVFRPGVGTIALADPIVYSGTQSLDLLGFGAVLDGGGLDDSDAQAFLADGGGNLSVTWLAVQNAPQQGLTVDVPDDATGTKKVTLVGFRSSGNGGHGVLINDQEFPEEAGNPDADPPIPPNPAGSPASLDVRVVASSFADNGFGTIDRDGLRVNEGGDGDLKGTITLTQVDRNGGDGVELDERGDGNAELNLTASHITRNGGFDLVVDPDDGVDVDESGAGSVLAHILLSTANDNFEEGWDLNENDAGDMRVGITSSQASRNAEEGVDLEEDDDFAGGGDLVAKVSGLVADGNAGDGGLKIREKDLGNLDATVRNVQANGNESDGIQIREDADGNLASTVGGSTAGANGGDGIEFEENSTGDLTATVDRGTTDGNTQDGIELDENGAGNLTGAATNGGSSGNGSAGVRADQQLAGTGTLSLVAMTLAGNTGGAVVAANVTVTQTP